MMKLLRDLSIKHKLVLILVFTSGLSLAIASAAFVGYDVAAYKRSFVRELEAQAHIIAYNSAAALTFDDYDSAAETIGALQKESRVVGAYLLSPEGQVFAQYERADVAGHFPRPRVDRDGAYFVEDRLVVRAPVEFDGDTIGHVYIEADLRELDERVSGYVGLATSIVASVLIVVFLASSRLQNVISEPILRLASTARLISREKDYGVRAAKFGDDEVGALIDGFNDMLTEIQTRDRELAQHRDRLEEAVVRRTAELWEVNERLRDSEERLRTIVEGTSSATGAQFFDALVTTLARSLGTRWVMVSELQDSGSVRVQAMWDGERVVKDQEYALAGTPCEHVVEDSFCLYEDNVAKVFPKDRLLADWGVRSYVGVLLRDSTGAPIGILNAFHDDTLSDAAREGSLLRVFASRAAAELERLQVEVELLESESRTRAILESAADGIVTIDEAGNIESMNRAAEEMFSCEAGALLGHHVAECMTFTDDDSHTTRLRADAAGVLAEFVGGRSELTGLRSNGGTPFPMNIAVGTMRAGGRNGFTAIVRDITRERELEQMKSDFVSTVSHEIRTPLAAIISSAKILLRGGETKPGVTAKFSSIIVEEGKRLTRLINDLLDLSKMDARKIDWTVKEAKPADIIQHVKDLSEGDAIAKKLAISVELEARIPAVFVDPDKVVQVLTHLVNNAVTFTPEGGQIRNTAHAREEGFVCIGVHDSGIGIAPEHRGIIFERFKQIGNVLTDRPQGTGLGLPICKQIVEYLGGRIWVDSELGKGSTFWFTLPVANAPVEAGATQPDVGDAEVTREAEARAEATRIETERAEAERVEAARREAQRAEAARAESARIEAERLEHTRAQAARIEAERAEAARAEAARAETARIEAERAEAARIEAARVETERIARIEAERAALAEAARVDAERSARAEDPSNDPDDGGAATGEIPEELPLAAASVQSTPVKSTILVVEDDPSTQEILRFTLETRDFEVVTAASVDEALRLAREHRPALITLDIVMPGGTGFDVLRAVRADADLAQTPVVLLSVMADDGNGERALKLGANAYLTKPCDALLLVRTVEGLVARDRRDVLIISDEATDTDQLKTSLRAQGYQVVEALDAKSGVTFAKQYPPDLILLQTAASNRQTQEILDELRGADATESIPVVLLAGDAVADGGAVYLGGWSEALRSDSMGISELLSSLVERFATRTVAVTAADSDERSADLS
jgi:PAS domain S-box-containing protein